VFDFIDHRLRIVATDGRSEALALEPQSVAEFHRKVLSRLEAFGAKPRFVGSPNEVENPIPFAEDEQHASYDPDRVRAFSTALNSAHRVFQDFRAGFAGKCSPVHFFWGSFDLAVTRFSGREAPEHPGGVVGLPDYITREAYSHEVSSAGFWPGSEQVPAIFYSYAYPTPEGFGDARVQPSAASFAEELGEFILPYDEVRSSPSPERTLLSFLQSTYEAAASLGGWDRHALEFSGAPEPES